ncbi:hypothetical protein [Francisella sp. SYW-2]|uniref:hypothetical protein n=1 Tax=Francisella sp. SYW-2 TaxID=2610886 RepID=UPI00123DA47F|nr:hypothetical protein [Francisella sp. SYW-2]
MKKFIGSLSSAIFLASLAFCNDINAKKTDYIRGDIELKNNMPKYTDAVVSINGTGNIVDIVSPEHVNIGKTIKAGYIMDSPSTIITSSQAKKSCETITTVESTTKTILGAAGIKPGSIFNISTEASKSWTNSITKATETCIDISQSLKQTYENFIERSQGAALQMYLENSYGEILLPNVEFGVIVVPVGVNTVSVFAIQPLPVLKSKVKVSLDYIGRNDDLLSASKDNAQLVVTSEGFKNVRFKVEYAGSKKDFMEEVESY